jgi:hypothetical protein
VGIGLGFTIKYLRRTKRQRPGHHDQVPPSHNERCQGVTVWAPRLSPCSVAAFSCRKLRAPHRGTALG